MEEERYGFVHDSEVEEVVLRFETMRKNNQTCYFDVIEFEAIIDFYLDTNNPYDAYEAMSLACELHPHSVPIQIRKARVMLEKGRAVDALSIVRYIENLEPGNYEIHICKGTALAMLGDISGAQKSFDMALTTDEEDEETVLFNITSVLQNLNFYEQMIPYIHRLAQKEPDFPAHIYDLAYAYDKKGDLDQSVFYYRQYLEEEPNADSAWYNLGIIYNKKGEYENALMAYDYALAINPANTFALFNKANILSTLEKYEEALDFYLEFVTEEPESLEGLTYLAECCDRTGNEEMAKKYYFEAIDLTPEYPDPWFGLGLLSLTRERVCESIPYLQKAVQLDNSNPDYWFTLGKALLLQDDLKQAVKCFRETLKLDAYFDEAWLEIGLVINITNTYNKAIQLLEQVKKISGEIPGIYYLLGSCYLHAGKPDGALANLKKASTLDATLFENYSPLLPPELLPDNITDIFDIEK